MVGKRIGSLGVGALLACFVVPALGQVQITEFMYDGPNREFVELTNRGASAVDFTGWVLDDGDNNPAATSVSLSAFGLVNPNESVVITQVAAGQDATTFRTAWGLPVTVKVITYTTGMYQRNDTIIVFDSGANIVTQLAYGDQTFAGTPRTNEDSAWPCGEALGLPAVNSAGVTSWRISTVADQQGSINSTNSDKGNPGFYTYFLCFCGNGVVDAAAGEQCDGGACCTSSCQFSSAGTECRASTGICDPAESCDGASAICPANFVSPAGTECRASAGDCDPAETCDGSNGACPANLLDPAGTECRASTGECDPAELCTGNSPSCPPDSLISICANGDGCCPAGCDANSDDDCDAVCGNGITEPGESCDGASVANCPSGVCNPNCSCHAVAVPTVSEWGLAILALVGLCAGTIMFGRAKAVRA